LFDEFASKLKPHYVHAGYAEHEKLTSMGVPQLKKELEKQEREIVKGQKKKDILTRLVILTPEEQELVGKHVEKDVLPKKKKKKTKKVASKKTNEDISKLTVKELKEMLDKKNIEYKSSDKKADLIKKLK